MLAACLYVSPVTAQQADLRQYERTIGAAPVKLEAADEGQIVRKVKPVRRPKRRSADSRMLPSLKSYFGANRIGLRGGESPRDSGLPPPPTIAVTPSILAKRHPPARDPPFAPVGFAAGSLRLNPYFEEDLGYASNPLSLHKATRGSLFENSEAGLSIQSDWARNDLHGALRGGYIDYFRDSPASAPFGDGTIASRYDISKDLSIDGETHFNIATQPPGSVSLPAGAPLSTLRRPLVETFGGSLAGTQKLGEMALSLRGTFDRIVYGNSTFAGGVTDDLSSDDSTDWGLRGRVAYQINPTITPFIEAVADRRNYDSFVDSGGYRRDSNGASASGGVTISLPHQLTGEASAGYGSRIYRDPRLPELSGPIFNASLAWGASPLTTITLKTTTTLADTATQGASGAVSRSYIIGVSHELLRNLTLTATANYTTNVYSGLNIHDASTNIGLEAEYVLTREFALKASATRARFISSLANADYDSNTFMFGLRFQR